MNERDLAELASNAKKACDMLAMEHPGVLIALIQTQALHRLADALAPLERIAGAMEANRARGEELSEPAPSTTAPRDFVDSAYLPQLPPWITDHLPNEFVASKGWVQVRAGGIFASFSNGDRGRIKPWNAIATGEAWAPLCLTKTFTYHVADAIPWKGFLAALSSTPSSEPAEPVTTPDESEAAMEIREAAAFGLCAPQEPPQPASATPGGHPSIRGAGSGAGCRRRGMGIGMGR